MKRDIESEVIEWLDWQIKIQSGGLGFPSSYDCGNMGRSGNKHTPTPPDFPKRLKVCDSVMRTMDQKHLCALQAKYLLLEATDSIRAQYLGLSESQYYRRVNSALEWLKIAYQIAEHIHKNLEMV